MPGCKRCKPAVRTRASSMSRKAVGKLNMNRNVANIRSLAFSQMSLQLAKMIYTYDMELVPNSRDWISGCKTHFFWWMPPLNVRFRPRGSASA